MSAPIAHLLISQEAYAPFFAEKNKAHIYIGTSFPDIRYLVGAKRELTHYTPRFLQESNDFLLGIDLHNWMDEARAAYFTFMVDDSYREKAPLLFNKEQINDLATKFFEDEVALMKIHDIDSMKTALSSLCDDEGVFGFEQEYLKIWHRNVLNYISSAGQGGDIALKHMINKDTEENFIAIQPYMKEYRTNPIYREFVSGMIDYVLKSFRIEMGRRFAK